MKRAIDALFAFLGLVALSPVIAVLAAAVKLGDGGPVFFAQERIGRGFRRFRIYKFRTMVVGAPDQAIAAGDPRSVTPVGRWLRPSKLDELPQLVNVLKGEMSLVGPRPEMPRFVEFYREEYREILAVRPGITDLASLLYRHEAKQLADSADPEAEYVGTILPEKMRLGRAYVRHASLRFDLWLLWATARCLVVPRHAPEQAIDAWRRNLESTGPSPVSKR